MRRLVTLAGWLAVASRAFGIASLDSPAWAQITPDSTLGAESSVVTPDVTVRGALADLIEGGAIRDANVFHSFDQFNVGEGERVYFANPVGIDNIIGRITGGDISQVLGTLGVDGGANLFLSNPQGFVFGENAQLDVTGSFLATTDSLQFEDGFEYRATNPEPDSPLTISVPLGLQRGGTVGKVINRGNLAAGQDFSLIAGDLDLEGEVTAGGNLLLQGNRVKIRDSVDAPFIAAAKGNLLVQGNESVDIFALNHGDSGLFSGGDMVLRSANAVGGDAHYWSGGSFRIEQLDGSLGDLFSPYDPIIRSFGDVFINGYQGTSLHILAGGSVTIGTATITGPETGTAGTDYLAESIILSNGEIQVIDGSLQATLEIRAGMEAPAIGTPPIPILTGFNSATDSFSGSAFVTTTPTSADIIIGNIVTNPVFGSGGKVLLTNQYKPNTSLDGSIAVGAIKTGDLFGGGSIIMDSRGEIAINGLLDASALNFSGKHFGDGGEITLIAEGDITSESPIFSDGLLGGKIDLTSNSSVFLKNDVVSNSTGSLLGKAEDVRIKTGSLSVTNGAVVGTLTFGQADAGNLLVEAKDSVEVIGTSANGLLASALLSQTQSSGNAGKVSIFTDRLSITGGARVLAVTFSEGNAGKIIIDTSESVEVIGSSNNGLFRSNIRNDQVNSKAMGNGGSLTIKTKALSIRDGAQVGSGSVGAGHGGNITITASDSLEVIGKGNGTRSLVSSATGGAGNAGKLEIKTERLSIRDGGRISASASGLGNGGNLIIIASNSLEIIGEESALLSETPGVGNAGKLEIKTKHLSIRDEGLISNSTSFSGNGGDIIITASDLLEVIGEGQLLSETFGAGNAGKLEIKTKRLSIRDGGFVSVSTSGSGNANNILVQASDIEINGGQVVTGTLGKGNGGSLIVIASDLIELSNTSSGLFTSSQGTGNAGNIKITTRHLKISDRANIQATTLDQGQGGNITVIAHDLIELIRGYPTGIATGLFSSTEGSGDAGNINIYTPRLIAREDARISANANPLSTGLGGNIKIVTEHLTLLGGVQIQAAASGSGNAGTITVDASDLVELIGVSSIRTNDGKPIPSGLFTTTVESGNAGKIIVDAVNLVLQEGAGIFAQSLGTGEAGKIIINVKMNLNANNGNIATAATQSSGGAINITAWDIFLRGDSDISTFVFSGEGGGGNIIINAGSIIAFDDSDILSFAQDGKGGDITLNTPAFFGQGFVLAPSGTNPITLRGNGRVDVNASGAINGTITQPDVTPVTNNLSELPENPIDTDALLANSCIVRTEGPQGKFIITGSGNLPTAPDNITTSSYPAGEVQALPEEDTNTPWQEGGPVIEATGIYQLPNGRLVMSRECS